VFNENRGAEAAPNIFQFPQKRQRFPLITFAEMKPGTAPSYLIKGLIPRVGLTVIWGPPKCGKSFLAFDAMMHVALGWKYRGKRVQQGTVVYCALEGASGFHARAEAFRTRKMAEAADEVPLYLMGAPLSLFADHRALIAAINEQLGDTIPAAVVIDTLNRSISGSESDDKDMGNFVRSADAIRDAFNCTTIVVHHCGLAQDRPRGHTSLTGAADAQLAVKRDRKANVVTLTVEYMKDGAEGEEIVSRLELVEVGTDDDGDPITSMVVEPVEGYVSPPGAGKLSDKQHNAMQTLFRGINDSGELLPATFGLPMPTKGLKAEDWKELLFRSGDLDRDAANPRTDFSRLKNQLKSKNKIVERDGLIWPL
jgi:hypothetical protein